MSQPIASSKEILSIIFILMGFLLATVFFKFIPFSPSDIFTIWLWTMLVAFMFGFAIFIFFGFNLKQTVGAIIFILFYSLIFFIPLPLDIRELIWALWLFFLVFCVWIYKRYRS